MLVDLNGIKNESMRESIFSLAVNLGAKKYDSDEDVYRKIQKDYRKEDARYHVEDRFGEKYASEVPDEIYELMADRFSQDHDCDIAENDLWEGVINAVICNAYGEYNDVNLPDLPDDVEE